MFTTLGIRYGAVGVHFCKEVIHDVATAVTFAVTTGDRLQMMVL